MKHTTRAKMLCVSALGSLLAAACSARAPTLPPPAADSARSAQLAPGITHSYRWYATGPWAVHTVTVEPRACGVGFRTIKAQDARVGRETTSAMARRIATNIEGDVVAAINADFFSFDPPGVNEGAQVANRVLLKSEGAQRPAVTRRPVFAIDRNGRGTVTVTRLGGTVTLGSTTLPLAGVNTIAREDSTFVYTPFWGETTPTDSSASEFVVRAHTVTLVDTLPEGVSIPDDGVVVAVKGAARTALLSVAPGTRADWQAALSGLEGAREVVAGYPMLLQNGHAVLQAEPGLRAPFSESRHPRTAIGLDRRGRIHMISVDGRQPGYSAGMSLPELGEFLMAHGITDALNFDGGGSTTLVIRGQIVNRPSDSNGERAVANALLLIDESATAGCARKP